MHIQSNDSILIASSHFFGFLSSWYVVALFAGRKARGRAPDEYLKRRRRVCTASKTDAPPRGFIPSGLTQPSIGELPHWIARVPAGIALPLFGSVPLPVPSADSQKLRPRLPSSSPS